MKLLAGHLEQADDVVAGLGVEVAGRLVGQDDGRLAGQRAGDGDALLLAAGEVVRQAVQLFLKPQQRDNLHDEGLIRFPAVQGDREDDVFPDAQHRHQVVVLEDKADLLAAEDGGLLAGKVCKLGAAHLDAALGGGVQPAQHVEQGGFARTGGADDGGEFAALDVQVHPVQRAHLRFAAAVVFFQSSCLQDDVACHDEVLLFLFCHHLTTPKSHLRYREGTVL